MPTSQHFSELETSKRFQTPPARRDFLGLAAAWSAIGAFAMAALGTLRLPMPSVFPESNSRVKLGRPARFRAGSTTHFPTQRLWLFRDDGGFHAISSVCTHLGCITVREEDGAFSCPCHGSKFGPDGALTGGPAPKGLAWVELSVSPEGFLVADTLKSVEPGTKLDV
ncbi:MAG: ubiquinol-cytochrome c reductase iron-sulfur subunit [Phycisphaerae bacterium]